MSQSINQLPPAGGVNSSDLLVLWRNNVTYNVPAAALQSGAGSTLGYFLPSEYGEATIDGVTDDILAIQAACNAAAAQPNGGVVFLQNGNWTISTTILLGNNVTLQGAGAESTIVSCTPGFQGATVKGSAPGPSVTMVANSLIASATAGILQYNMQVCDIQFNGRGDVIQPPATNPGATLFFKSVRNLAIDRCEFYNMPNTVIQVAGDSTSTDWPVAFDTTFRMSYNRINSTYNPTGPPPVYPGGPNTTPLNVLLRGVNNVLILGNVVNDLVADTGSLKSKDIFDVNGCSYVVVDSNIAYDGGDGCDFDTGGYFCITNNVFERMNGRGVALYASDGNPATTPGQFYGVIANNVISNLGTDVAGATQPGKQAILLASASTSSLVSKAIIIANNSISYANTAFGPSCIDIEANHCICTGNVVDMGNAPLVLQGIRVNSASGGGNNCTVSDNIVFNGYATGTVGYVVNFNNSNNITGLILTGNQCNGVTSQFLYDSTGGSLTNSHSSNNSWNPIGNVSAPGSGGSLGVVALPTSGTVETNPYPYDCNVYIGGTAVITAVSVSGQTLGIAAPSGSNTSVMVPANMTIAVTWTGSGGTWCWMAN